MAIEKTIIINTDTTKAVKGVDNLKNSIKDTSKEIENTESTSKQMGAALDEATGGAITKFKGMITAVKGLAVGFKGVGVAIAASGLGLLLLTVGALKAAFTGSEEGQNKFAKLMGVIGAVTGNVIDLLADLGDYLISVFENPKKAITEFGNFLKKNFTNRIEGIKESFGAAGKAAKLFFSGDFAGAAKVALDASAKVALGVENITDKLKDATAATKEFLNEQIREGNAAADVADKRAKADILSRELLVDRANLENKIAQLRLKSREEEKFSAKERKSAIVEAQELEDILLKKETEVLKLRSDAIKLENTFSRSNKENLDAEAESIAAVARQEAARTNAQRATQRELNRLNKEISAEANRIAKEKQAAIDKEIAEELKRLESIDKIKQKFLDADAENDAKTRQEKLDLERARAQEDLDLLIGSETEKKEAQLALNALYDQKDSELKALKFEEDNAQRAKAYDENIAAEKKLNEAKIEAQEKVVNATKSALNTAASLLGESTAAGKAAAIAATTIDTIQSGVSAYKGMVAAIPGPVGIAAGAVAAAGSLASGYASVKKILSVKTPKGGGGGSAPSAPSPPQAPAFNLVGQSGVNQVQDSLQEEQTPIQAYVVGSEVTSQQELDRNQQNSASI